MSGTTLRFGQADRSSLFDGPVTMTIVLAALFLTGALVGGLSLVLDRPAEIEEGPLWSNVALAAVGGLVLLAARNRMPVWGIKIAIIAGIVVITRAVHYGDGGGDYYTFWYVWVGVYACFFFGRAWGLGAVALMAAAYAWVLTQAPGGTSAEWVVIVGSTAVAGILNDFLARRLRRETVAAATRAANLGAVGEVARQLATQSDSRAVGSAICTAALKATGASASALWLPSPGGSELVARASAGPKLKKTTIPFVTPQSGAIRAFTSAEPRFKSAAEHGAREELHPQFGNGAALWQPVQADDRVVGVLSVYWAEPEGDPGEEVRQALRLLGLEAAIAIERGELLGRLEQAARTDDLTGLLNRRAWSSELARELARAKRSKQPLCVAVLDLDRFKQFNDDHGHQAGDRFLKQVAGLWSNSLRPSDIIARHGGEEFALAMPETGLEEARAMLERLCDSVPGGETCSGGVCLWDGSESPEALLDRADTALYEAKDAGRNRVVVAA